MKIKLELNIPDDRKFLNFWDWKNGNDVVCEIIDGKLMLSQSDDSGESLPPKEITLKEFVERVEKVTQN
jgi:hypothetical protein